MDKKMKVVLVGGGGFIGHHIALALAKDNKYDVSIVDNFRVNNLIPHLINPTGDYSFRMFVLLERLQLLFGNKIPIYQIDARDYMKLSYVLNKTIGADVVIHLAAVAHAGKSNKEPQDTFDNSMVTLENSLDSCRESSIKQFVYFSSSTVYGNFTGSVNEESKCDPVGIYGTLKLFGEKLVQEYGKMYGLPYTIVRPSALYGPRCLSRRVTQVFIENVMQGKEITVQGGLESSLDFTYIDDLVSGILRMIEKGDVAIGQVFNITYGCAQSLEILVGEVLSNCSECKIDEYKIKITEMERGIPFRGTLDITKARRILGYEPVYNLKEGIKKYVEWYRGTPVYGRCLAK